MIGPPFDRSAHTVDLRHIDSKRGYYNIPNIGIFLWRLQAYPVVNAPAFSLGDGKYTFSQLGYDLPIYNNPETDTSIDHITTELNVPTRIRRIALKKYLKIYETESNNFAYKKSIKIVKSVLVENGDQEQIIEVQIPPDSIAVCNLSKWHHRPPKEKKVGIDPEFGRIIFPESESEKIVDVHVSYYYGFSGDIGGGFYDRKESGEKEAILLMSEELQQDLVHHYKISKKNPKRFHISLSKALEKWTEEFHDKRDVIFEIIDSEIYTDFDANGNNVTPIEIEIPENITVVIRSQNLQRPIFWLNKPITVKGKKGSKIIFDGILFVTADDSPGSSEIQLYDNNNTILKIAKGDLSKLIINHCTFVPGRTILENGRIKQEKNMGRLLFSWENIPQVEDDIKRLKKYLFDILDEEWIMEDGVVLNKVATENNIIEIFPAGTDKASIKLELNSHLSLILIKIRETGEEGRSRRRIPYNLQTADFRIEWSNECI